MTETCLPKRGKSIANHSEFIALRFNSSVVETRDRTSTQAGDMSAAYSRPDHYGEIRIITRWKGV